MGAIAADVAGPQAIRLAIDRGIADQNTTLILAFAATAAGLLIARGVLTAVHDFLIQYMAHKVSRDMRNEYFSHLQTLSYSYYDRANSGDLISRAVSDIESARMAVGMGLFQIITVTGTFVVVFIAMVLTNWQLAVLAMVTLPVMVGTALKFGKVIRQLWRRVQAQRGEMTAVLTENLTGVRVVKAFAQEPRQIERYSGSVRQLNDNMLAAMRNWSVFFPLMLFLSSLGTVAVIWLGGYLVITDVVSVGALIAFYYYFVRLAPPSRRIGFIVQRLQLAIASAERLFEVLDTKPEIASKAGALAPRAVRGRVEFDHVTFAYGRGAPQLRDINLVIEPGQTLGIIGPTGSGKTTLINLIMRFYDVSSGHLTFDGTDVRDLDLHWLRSRIAMVPQDAYLFSNTMAKNIAFARPSARLDAIVAAAEQAQAGRFIDALPDRYDTIVGERGVGLSGGQRQRVTISRALLMNAGVLIMDDSTASLDTATERLIREELQEAFSGRTTILIGQRVSTVMNCDEIVVMDAGKIVERGTHEALLAARGLYHRINLLQSPAEALEIDGRPASGGNPG
ncbi:MAG: ABC transporter ATP-binding protein [Chloroflexi bacterium]|nr:ABC transporter ATP-binding protein [Chloroflexota bacterium]MCY3937620.1 ABC transporter ATP-binding protein [Chloroflexota bacterium]